MLILFCHQVAVAQYESQLLSKELMYEALELEADEKVDEALVVYDKIPQNDSNYTHALIRKIYIHFNKDNFEEVVALSELGFKFTEDENYSDFFLLKGLGLVSLEKYDEAMDNYNRGLKMYPKNHRIVYSIAKLHLNKEEYEQYLVKLKEAVTMYPYYTKGHLELGRAALKEGELTECLMSYLMALIIEPTGETANQTLSLVNALVTQKVEGEPLGIKLSPEGDDFSEVDLILKNYAALQKGYKVKSKADLPLVKQVQVMLETMEYDKEDPGFWMQFYGSFYKQLWNEEMFEAFSYYLLQSSANAKHQKLVKKKTYDINRFSKWAGVKIRLKGDHVDEVIAGKKQKVQHLYYTGSSGGLQSMGKLDGARSAGCWELYHPNGALSGEGCYDAIGQLKGEWKRYYDNGGLNIVFNVVNDKLDGEWKQYYRNGRIMREATFKQGIEEGISKDYYLTGGISRQRTFVGDKETGPGTTYYGTGSKNYEYVSKDDELDGELNIYYPNGKLKEKTFYKSGKLQGESKGYYANDKPAFEYRYYDGKYDGAYKRFYENGNLKEEGTYKLDKLVGETVSYFEDGTVSDRLVYDEEGKKNGKYIEYDRDGIKFLEFEYKKGNIVGYKNFDKSGKIVKEDSQKGGDFYYTSMFADGELRSEGLYNIRGGSEGEWKFYDYNGTLKSTVKYKDDLREGEYVSYYANGAVYQKSTYNKGNENGPSTAWYRNGKYSQLGWMNEGSTEGEWLNFYQNGTVRNRLYFLFDGQNGWQKYYAVDGKLDYEIFYKNGILLRTVYYDSSGTILGDNNYADSSGLFKKFHPNKQLALEAAYVNGEAHGPFTWYYANGQVETKGQFVNGERHGNWTHYYLDGVVSQTNAYFYGDFHGPMKRYHKNGKLSADYIYEYGEKHGKEYTYHDNGQVSTEEEVKHGSTHGVRNFYNRNGDLEHIRYYHYGKIVGYSYLGKDNKPVAKIPIKNETSKVVSYFSNGQMSRSFELQRGLFHGEYLKWYPSGKIYEKSTYDANLLQGLEEKFYENGKPLSVETYVDGDLNGECRYYNEQGQVERVERYLNGGAQGAWEYYAKGNLIKTVYYYNGDFLSEKSGE